MAELARVVDGAWFTDTRTPERRLRVSFHDEDGLAVLTTWRQDRCVGSIRLPISEAGRLAQHLVGGLTDVAVGTTAEPAAEPRARRWRAAWLGRLRRARGQVISLDDHR